MIPTFPTFKKLDLESSTEIRQFVATFPSYTEFNFTNMFVWDVASPIFISRLNGNLVVKFVNFQKEDYYYSLIGYENIDRSIDAILKLSIQEGHSASLYTVPEVVAKNIKYLPSITVSEDENNHDYILAISDLIHFTSEKFREKRNQINRFKTKYGQNYVKEIDLSDPDNVKLVRGVLESWESKISRGNIDIITEFAAIEKSIIHYKELKLKCFATFVDGKMEAFTIFEVLDSENVMMHFEKANRKFSGIYEYQKHQLAKQLDILGIKYLNYGQDLGYDGLRKSKSSYHPIKMHKKYTLTHVATNVGTTSTANPVRDKELKRA